MSHNFLKIFCSWFKLKTLLYEKSSKIQFKQGDIWWCSLGVNLGEEIFGKGHAFTRPVLIFRKFTHSSFMGLPLTRHGKEGSWYAPVTIRGTRSYILLNQARILDKKRLTSRVAAVEEVDFKRVQEKFVALYTSK